MARQRSFSVKKCIVLVAGLRAGHRLGIALFLPYFLPGTLWTKQKELFLLLAAALVAVDQVVKYLVRAGIPLHTAVDFLPGLDLTYVQNTGAAFSLFSQHTWLLTLLSGVVSVVLVICLGKRVLPHWSGMLALALLLGGAVGNFIDRLLFGFVTDMFATTFVNFAVFNVADVGVVLGGVLLCLHLIVFFGREGKKEPDKEETP